MNIEIGSYEAKSKLPELLRAVGLGQHYTITLRGKAVAELVPADNTQRHEVTDAVAHMLRLMDAAVPIKGVDTKSMIEDGRD